MDTDDVLVDIINELGEEPGETRVDGFGGLVEQEEIVTKDTGNSDEEVNKNSDKETLKTKGTRSRASELPLSKIKGIMKMDPEVTMVASDAVFAVAKATELFIQSMAKETYRHTSVQKKKTVQRAHVDLALNDSASLFFLEDALD